MSRSRWFIAADWLGFACQISWIVLHAYILCHAFIPSSVLMIVVSVLYAGWFYRQATSRQVANS